MLESDFCPFAECQVCAANSICILIYLYFQELRSEIELEVVGDTEELQMSFTAICPNATVLPDLKRCSNVKPGETVSCFALILCNCTILLLQASAAQSALQSTGKLNLLVRE